MGSPTVFFCGEKGEKMSAYQNYLAVAKAQRDLLVEVIGAHGGDWSIDELSRLLEYDKRIMAERINELVTIGVLVEYPRRTDWVTGGIVRPVGLPSGQNRLGL